MKKLLALPAALTALALAGAVAIAQEAAPFANYSDVFAQLPKDTAGAVQQQIMHAPAGDVMAVYIVRTARQMYTKQDELLIVLSGHGTATVGYPSFQLQPGSVVSIPRNTAFQITSNGKSPIKAYVIVTPSDNPNDKRVLEP
ncbi:MAG TPA: cupin domain-containing protein [Candidatus Baltobacteraceae bacterium]|nr:cupin domain-containing protein [Candidatus Baltobacteraceae bacterium]